MTSSLSSSSSPQSLDGKQSHTASWHRTAALGWFLGVPCLPYKWEISRNPQKLHTGELGVTAHISKHIYREKNLNSVKEIKQYQNSLQITENSCLICHSSFVF